MDSWTLIDTETTGFAAPIHILEIAAQRFEGFEPVGNPIRLFLDHGVEVPNDAHAIHGYTKEFLAEVGEDPMIVYEKFRNYVGESLIASHYLAFDWNRALEPELYRLQLDQIGQRGFCSWMLARRTLQYLPSHRLDFLRDQLGLEWSKAHSALGDVEATVDLLCRYIFPQLRRAGLESFREVPLFAQAPILSCRCMLEGLNYEDEFRRIKEAQKEKRKWNQFLEEVAAGAHEMPKLIIDHGLIQEHPQIVFKNKRFLFTGKLAFGSRKLAEEEIEKRGGLVAKSKAVSKDINYLVLGECNEKGWTELLTGNKLRNAFMRKLSNSGYAFEIIREEDLVSSL